MNIEPELSAHLEVIARCFRMFLMFLFIRIGLPAVMPRFILFLNPKL